MNTKANVLKTLSKNIGLSVSGESIAKELGISRNAVCKAVAALKKDGWNINSSTNKGYMLCSGDVIVAEEIQAMLGEGFQIEYFEEVESTNDIARERAVSLCDEGLVIIASAQTKGRGRKGREFISPKGSGLYMSVVLRPEFSPQQALLITTAAAVAAAKAIEKHCGVSAGIKWVNDIYCNGKKVCGILTEAAMNMETSRLDYAILGIGINVYEPDGGFDIQIKDIAGAVCGMEPKQGLRNLLAAEFLKEFFKIYNQEEQTFMEEYRRRSVVLGKKITAYRGNEVFEAVAVDIDNEGGLVVKTVDGAVQTLQSGEITIRGDFGA